MSMSPDLRLEPWLDRVILGDCAEVLRDIPDASVDALCADPPAGIGFMGRNWDGAKGGRDQWAAWLAGIMTEARRCIRPGGYALVWALPRTSHWTAMALEDAGWTIRDSVHHIFGQGMPKGKACLKPAHEVWWLAKTPGPLRPLQTVACRVGTTRDVPASLSRNKTPHGIYGAYGGGATKELDATHGRWPSNLLLDMDAAQVLDAQAGPHPSGGTPFRRMGMGYHGAKGQIAVNGDHGNTGGASRFFPVFSPAAEDAVPFQYQSKASRRDRGEGNTHPTCKNTELMRWLCRLICPPGGVVLDPFAGSSSTAVACIKEGFHYIMIEQEQAYYDISVARLARVREEQDAIAAIS